MGTVKVNREIPRALVLDLSHRFGGASERTIGLLHSMPQGSAALGAIESSPVALRARQMGLETHAVGTSKFDPRIGRNLRRLVKAGGFEVIDSQNPQARFWAAFVSRDCGVAHVATMNSWPAREYGNGFRGYFYLCLDRCGRPRTDMYIAVSGEIEQALLDTGTPPDRIELISNAVAVRLEHSTDDNSWKDDLGIAGDSSVCCAVGRLVEVKGLRYLVTAMQRLHNGAVDLVCVIVGDGSERKVLEDRIASNGLEGRVILAGQRDHPEVLRIIGQCDFFVMPSLSEGTPIALLEAAMLGRPIVASSVGGIPDIVVDQETGILVPPGDANALSQALEWLCRNPDKARQMGRQARRRVEEHFDMETMLAGVVAAYHKALDQKKRS